MHHFVRHPAPSKHCDRFESLEAYTRYTDHTARAIRQVCERIGLCSTTWFIVDDMVISKWACWHITFGFTNALVESKETNQDVLWEEIAQVEKRAAAAEQRAQEEYLARRPRNFKTRINMRFRPRVYNRRPFGAGLGKMKCLWIFNDLPALYKNEFEIARLTYTATVHCEVTSIRARKVDGLWHYRIVSEQDHEKGVTCSVETSRRPLTLEELVDLIEYSFDEDNNRPGLYFGDLRARLNYRDYDPRRRLLDELQPEDLRGFIDVSSAYYKDLGKWYEEAFEIWCAQEIAARQAELHEEAEDS